MMTSERRRSTQRWVLAGIGSPSCSLPAAPGLSDSGGKKLYAAWGNPKCSLRLFVSTQATA